MQQSQARGLVLIVSDRSGLDFSDCSSFNIHEWEDHVKQQAQCTPPLPSSVVSEIHSFLIQLFSDVKMPFRSITKGIYVFQSKQKGWIKKRQAFSFSVTQNLHVREILLAIWDHLEREGAFACFIIADQETRNSYEW